MAKYFILFNIVALISLLVIDFSTTLVAFIVYFFGMFLLFLVNIKDSRNLIHIISIYQIVFIVGFIYILMCYIYMTLHGYQYLLSPDTYYYFLPTAESFLQYNNVVAAEIENWRDFNFFSRYHSGYFGYLIPFTYFSSSLGANLQVSLQFSTLLVASLSSVVIFRLFLVNKFESKKAYRYAIIICLFSVVFFYSTQLLRDIHIMFFYLLGIYLTFKKEFSILNLFKLLLVIGTCCTLRIETGLFLFILVPVYLLLTMQYSRKRNVAVFMSFIIATIGIATLAVYSNQITSVFSYNNDIYLESNKGSGVIGNLQKIPVAGDFLSIVYNAAQPLPFWNKYEPSIEDNREEIYNIMTFPLSLASLFNWIVLTFTLTFLLNKNIRVKVSKSISKPLKYNLYVGVIFLYIQSSVIDQRRIMAYYIVFYILFYTIYTNVTIKDRQQLLLAAYSSYTALQFFALLYKI